MPLELRILTGARAGQRETFDADVTIGRAPGNALRFDANKDLDVSSNHAALSQVHGRWILVDRGSTNGTFLNGEKVATETPVKDGDVIAFGANGPKVEVHGATPKRAGANTEQRVAIAVKQETRGLKKMLGAAVLVLGVLAIGGYWFGHQESNAQIKELQSLLAQSESLGTKAGSQLAGIGDTALTNALQRERDSLAKLVATSAGKSADQIAALKSRIQQSSATQQGLVELNLEQISSRNEGAVAFLITTFGENSFSGTAFNVSPAGLLVTNRHNVQRDGAMATAVGVRFANTNVTLPAKVVRVSDDPDVDLAIIELDQRGSYPVVSGISAQERGQGATVALIGFPAGLDLPQQGTTMKTSLFAGTISKRTSTELQIDSWQTQGASGSPVFDSSGLVIGVVHAGMPNTNGRVVLAVPSAAVIKLLPDAAHGIVK